MLITLESVLSHPVFSVLWRSCVYRHRAVCCSHSNISRNGMFMTQWEAGPSAAALHCPDYSPAAPNCSSLVCLYTYRKYSSYSLWFSCYVSDIQPATCLKPLRIVTIVLCALSDIIMMGKDLTPLHIAPPLANSVFQQLSYSIMSPVIQQLESHCTL